MYSAVNSFKSMEILGKYPDFVYFFSNSSYCMIKAGNNLKLSDLNVHVFFYTSYR